MEVCRSAQDLLPNPQMAEQLVEVPTDVSFFSEFVEQTIDIVVGGIFKFFSQDRVPQFLPSRLMTIQFRVVVGMEVYKVFT